MLNFTINSEIYFHSNYAEKRGNRQNIDDNDNEYFYVVITSAEGKVRLNRNLYKSKTFTSS